FGLPFLLFFPGYVLVAVLFVRTEGIDEIERIALSFGMSIAVTALIGLGLNYTPWGIRLEPVLYSIATFILVMSVIALLRQYRLFKKVAFIADYEFKLPGWEGNTSNKVLSIILIIAILGTIGVLGFTVIKPKIGERFTEYYILGIGSKAQDYPTEFTMDSDQVTRVQYGTEIPEMIAERGMITLGIVNHEYQTMSYQITITIDNEPISIFYDDESLAKLGPIELANEEQWEHIIGFVPVHTGENQKVEFLLFKNTESNPYLTLHLWIDVISN
ncbi:MAG: DUF1616 domain-containing protein, partial [Dehalococcoidales bacterium]|nr:DUF1616 domain-containing protein [Dehalococcoidales bacterium]